MQPLVQKTLDELLDRMPHYGSEFAGTYANHAPMVLLALARLGGSSDRLERFFSFYDESKQLLPFATSKVVIDADNWRDHLGDRSAEEAYRTFFSTQLADHGRDQMLARWLPRLAPGIGASAFHALMRAAYSVIGGRHTESVNALAYWCATWLAMPVTTGTPPISGNPVTVLLHAAALPSTRTLTIKDLIWQNMQDAFALPDFSSAGDWFEAGDDALADCASAALTLFAATQDFCALHALTGLHWIRVLEPYHDATPQMVRHFWTGVVALMNKMEYPSLPAAHSVDAWRSLPCPDWEEIFACASQSLDEHDLSLVFSCSQEEKIYGDPLYRRVAARRLALIPEMKI